MRYKSFTLLLLCSFIGISIILSSCGGGGNPDTTGDDSTDIGDNNSEDTTTPTPPSISGFNFTLKEGDFWEYQWDYYNNSWAQGSSGSTTNRAGRFRVSLGPSVLIQGIEVFEIIVSGRSKVISSTTTDFAPKWKYVAISDNKILGGTSTSSLSTIFDAQEGIWLGGGFFTSFSTSTLISAVASSVTNDYLTDSGYKVEQSSSEDQCEYFPGVGTICGDSSYNYTEREFYKSDVGPLAYYYYNAYSDCGGNFCSGATWEYNVGLVKSSMSGEFVNYDLEVETNNSIADATPIDMSRGLWGDLVDEDDFGSTQIIPVNTTVESSNNTSAGAQVINVPTQIVGNVLNGDSGETLTIANFPSSGQTYTEMVEDWYYFTLGQTETWKFFLDFSSDSTADLDIFILQDTTGYPLKGSSISDNPLNSNPAETITVSLGAGSYWLAVDGYLTPSGRVNYLLNVDRSSNPSNSVAVADWLTFTLNSQTSLVIQGVGGPSMMLMDGTGSDLLNSDFAATSGETTQISTDLLVPGDYFLGLGKSINTNDNYQITITTQ